MAAVQSGRALVRIVALVVVFLVGNAWAEETVEMRLSPTSLEQATESMTNVTVHCRVLGNRNAGGATSSGGPKLLSRLRVLVSTETSSWKPIAQIIFTEPDRIHLDPDTTFYDVTGLIGPLDNGTDSEVRFTWAATAEDALRSVRCDAVLLDGNSPESVDYKFTDKRLNVSGLSAANWVQALASNREKIDAQLESLSSAAQDADTMTERWALEMSRVDGTFRLVTSRLGETVTSVRSRTEDITSTLRVLYERKIAENYERLAALESTISTIVGPLTNWPEGTYGLPKTASGCPDESWKTGWRKHNTETSSGGSNRDSVSDGHHLEEPVAVREGGRNYVYQRFCTKDEDNNSGTPWPSGSYCINKLGSCPPGFSSGAIRWDDEDSGNSGSWGGTLPEALERGTYPNKFFYCCRSDGATDAPIDLPRFSPFYLYPYRSECQAVKDMRVKKEYIYFDTENSSNNDKGYDVHPRVQLNNLILYLCYYEMEQM